MWKELQEFKPRIVDIESPCLKVDRKFGQLWSIDTSLFMVLS